MSYSVEAWDPSYGSTFAAEDEDGLSGSKAELEPDIEIPAAEWRAIGPRKGQNHPPTVLFVDGVRRVDARIWIRSAELDDEAALGLCASYASGVVVCRHDSRGNSAGIGGSDVRRGLFTTALEAREIPAPAGNYRAHVTDADPATPLPALLSALLQQRLSELEISVAVAARDQLEPSQQDEDLLVIDGPLRGRQHLPRTIGYIKTHHSRYLPSELNQLVSKLEPGYRTPVFRMGTNWERYSWYLRLPYREGAPWAGIVRVECSADLTAADAVELAYLSQSVLVRYASDEIKDPRAPQNLYPIAGLERELRRRLGNPQLLHRSLRTRRG
ncbi:DNA double-strand break repair nuclease NurA [Kineosporia babensis]